MADDVNRESVSRGEGAFGPPAAPPPSSFDGDRGAPPAKDAGFWASAGDALRTGLGQAGSWAGV